MKARAITERVAAPFTGSTVNREAGTIDGVLVCGRESKNNRLYPWGKELKHKSGTYESAQVNCNHGDDSVVERVLGWLSNETTDDQGRPRARLNVLKTHPMAERVFESAERNPSLFGLSHVAMCQTREQDGVEVVTSIEKVISVDLVATPATTKGFYESQQPKAKTMTIKQLLEKIAAKSSVDQLLCLKRLGEMDGMDVMEVPSASEDPDEAIKGAFKAAMNSQVDAFVSGTLDFKTFIGKLKEVAKASGKITGAEVDVEVEKKDGAKSDYDMEESAKRKHASAILEALDLATKLGFKADKSDLEIIAAVPADGREAVVKRLQGTANATTSGAKSSTRQTESFNTNEQQAKTESATPVDLSVGWIA